MISCTVKMLAAIKSTDWCRKCDCVHELESRKCFSNSGLSKDRKTSHWPWTSQLQALFFFVLSLPLPPRFILQFLWHLELLSPCPQSMRNCCLDWT